MTGILKYITYITYNMKKPVITVGAFVFATLLNSSCQKNQEMVYRDMTIGDDPTEVIVRTKAARAANPTWTDRIYMFLCNYFNTSNISQTTSFMRDLYADETELMELSDLLYDNFGVEIDDDDWTTRIITYGDLYQECLEQRDMVLSDSPRLNISYAEYASGIAEHFSIQCIDPDDRFKEDLGGDSLDMVEIVIMLEDEYDVTIPDKAMNMFYYQVKDLFYYLTKKVI